MGKVKNWTVEKKDEIELILIDMWTSLAMAIPDNYEDIVQDCYEDVCETADPINWNDGDVAIAFRRWIESQAMSNTKETGIKDSNNVPIKEGDILNIGLDGTYNVRLNTVGDLRNALVELSDDDQLTLVTIDLQTGDEHDHYPMHLDVIDGIKLTNGNTVNEVQFIQEMNAKPDTRDKQPLIDAVTQEIMSDYEKGDTTVIDELLKFVPWEILKGSLPEERWEEFNPEGLSDEELEAKL